MATRKVACQRGRKLLLPAPHQPVCLFVGTPSHCARTCARANRKSASRSVLLLALLDDVFADNELAGRASAELLEGEAAHQLLVGGRALGACTG